MTNGMWRGLADRALLANPICWVIAAALALGSTALIIWTW